MVKDTMSPKERVSKTFAFEKPDRVTIGYEANAGVHARFAAALGVPDGDLEKVIEAIGVDYRRAWPEYSGPDLFGEPPAGMKINPVEGCRMRWVEHSSGGYWDFCDFPLLGASDDAIAAFPVPSPDDFDYEGVVNYVNKMGKKYAMFIGNAGVPDIINSNGRIMGMEDVLVHLALGNEAAITFINRRADTYLGVMERIMHRCPGQIDFMWLGEDLGTQIAPMISLELYRKRVKPIHKKFCDFAKAFGLPVIIHTCGSSSWVYEDFIEIGVNAVDTLQPEAANMSPAYLAEHFGGRLGFRGCISTAGPLTYGTPADVTRVCRETLELMKSCGGYHFAPTHAIQDNTPVENVAAMYDAVLEYGYY